MPAKKFTTDKKLTIRLTEDDIAQLKIIMRLGKYHTMTEWVRHALQKFSHELLQPHTEI